MPDSTDTFHQSYPDIPPRLIHEPVDDPCKADKVWACYPSGRILFCEIDERSWAKELVRRWNAFVSRDKLIEDARLSAAEMKCAADEVEEEGAPTVASGYRKAAILLTCLAFRLDRDAETAELAERGAGVIAAVQAYMEEAERPEDDDSEDGLGRALFDLRYAWLVFTKVHD